MALSKRREKDQAMAAQMKRDGVRRASARCPICGRLVALAQLTQHVGLHR